MADFQSPSRTLAGTRPSTGGHQVPCSDAHSEALGARQVPVDVRIVKDLTFSRGGTYRPEVHQHILKSMISGIGVCKEKKKKHVGEFGEQPGGAESGARLAGGQRGFSRETLRLRPQGEGQVHLRGGGAASANVLGSGHTQHDQAREREWLQGSEWGESRREVADETTRTPGAMQRSIDFA